MRVKKFVKIEGKEGQKGVLVLESKLAELSLLSKCGNCLGINLISHCMELIKRRLKRNESQEGRGAKEFTKRNKKEKIKLSVAEEGSRISQTCLRVINPDRRLFLPAGPCNYSSNLEENYSDENAYLLNNTSNHS